MRFLKPREAMSNSGRLGGYEHIATRWGRGEVKIDRVGDKLLQLVKYVKKLSTYVDKTVDKMICR